MLVVPGFMAGCGVPQAIQTRAPLPAEPFLQWFGIDRLVLSRAFGRLAVRGADRADIYLQHRRETVIEMRDGIVSRADTRIEQGAGLRVISGDATGYAATEDLTPAALQGAAAEAAASVTGTVAGRSPAQAWVAAPAGDLYTVAVPWSEIGADRKLPIIERLDRAARSADPAIDRVSVSWSDVDEQVTIATLDGRLVGDARPMTRLSIQVSALKAGRRENGFASLAARDDISCYSDAAVERLARDAVGRALLRFDAQPAPTGDLPVVLAAGTSGILLHEAIGHALEADFNQQGVSRYADRIGGRIADASVSLVDQATMPNERGALNYDDEGFDGRRTVLVERGVLRGFLHDTETAERSASETTASGRRESYRFAPMPRMTCTFLENGPRARDEIIASVKFGVVAETYTGGHVELGGGDYAFDVGTGWLIEGGRLTAPLADFRVTGNGPDTLQRITMVAGDGRMDAGGWTCGKHGQQVPVSQGMPTVLVSSLAVAADERPRRDPA